MMRLPTRHGALLIAAGGHVALLWPLLATPEVAPRLASVPVMTVSLLAAPTPRREAAPASARAPSPSPAAAVVRPPLAQPLPRPLTEPSPAVRTLEPAPVTTPIVAATLPATPVPPTAAASPAAVQSVAATPAQPAPPADAPVVEARFDAAYLNNPRPAYPPLARRLGEQGQVLLRAYVSAEGRPEQVELRRSSGSPRLDAAAQETVRRWRFVPARRGDTPIAAWVLIPINFRLES